MIAQTSAPQVELLGCPLCKSYACMTHGEYYRVECSNQGHCRATTRHFTYEADAIKAWNTRPSPDSGGVEARPKIASDLQELMDVIEAVRGQRGLLRVSGTRGDPNDVGVLGIERFNDLMMRAIEALSIRPQASAGERGITDTMVLTGAKAIYIERSGAAEHLRINEKTCDEHFDWYEVGKSNPDSCVHYSNIAFALRDARACLSATLEPGRGK